MGNSADIRLTERDAPPRAEERTIADVSPGHEERTAHKEPSDMTLPELFERFERDMTYDAHGHVIRYSRSEARREIQRRGVKATDDDAAHKMIFAIIEYLRSGKSINEPYCRDNVDGGWASLLAAIARHEPVR